MKWRDIESSGDLPQEDFWKRAHRRFSSMTMARNKTALGTAVVEAILP